MAKNAKFTFIFDKENSDFILGNNDDFVTGLDFATLQLSKDSLYWKQNNEKAPELGVTGIRFNDKDYSIPKASGKKEPYEYIFDTASQMIGVPTGNTWDETSFDYYFFDKFIQTVLSPLKLVNKQYYNRCFQDAEQYGYGYNNDANNCYFVPCNTQLY